TDNDINSMPQIQQDILTYKKEDTNQIIVDNLCDDSYANSLADTLNDFFYSLNKEIPTEDILTENDIINLIQSKMRSKNDDPNHSYDSKEEPEVVSLNDASKLLHTWVTLFEQQQLDEFKKENIYIFKKYLKIVKRLKFQAKKQVAITDFFAYKD
ncbi:5514_t:CDS:1, partial [Cetraspora pellucida]